MINENIPKSVDHNVTILTTDEGNDKQEVYITTQTQSINKIIRTSLLQSNTNTNANNFKSLSEIINETKINFINKYSRGPNFYFVFNNNSIVNKRLKRHYINMYKEILVENSISITTSKSNNPYIKK